MSKKDNSETDAKGSERRAAESEKIIELVQADGGTETSPLQQTVETKTQRRSKFRKWYRSFIYEPFMVIRSDPRAIIGLGILGIYAAFGLASIFFIEPTYPFDGEPYVQPFETWEHPLGTDQTGKDLFSGATNSIVIVSKMMFSGTLFTIVMGTSVGIVSGYKGGNLDRALSTFTDIFINLPGLPLVIVLAILFSPKDPFVLGLLLSVAAWAGLARAIRSQVLTLREESFVEASRAMGVSTPKILYKEILPHLMPYIAINSASAAQNIIFSSVALYFLGLLPYTGSNWGIMLSEAYSVNAFLDPKALHWVWVPVLSIMFLSIGLTLLAQSLDRVFNPRVRARHAEKADIDDEEESTVTVGELGFQK